MFVLHHLPDLGVEFFGLPISLSHEHRNSSSSLHKLRSASEVLSCPRVAAFLPEVVVLRSFLFLVFAELFQSSPNSGPGTVINFASSAIPSDMTYTSVSLFEIS